PSTRSRARPANPPNRTNEMNHQGKHGYTSTRAHPRFRASPFAAALVAGVLAGCAGSPHQVRNEPPQAARVDPLAAYRPDTHFYDAIPKDRLNTATRQVAAEGLKALDAGTYEKANRLFNFALKTDINNSYLHLLNAYAYHLRGMGGEGALYALAQQGYEQALQFDPGNVVARQYLGILYLDRRNYAAARDQLMEAALYEPDNAEMMYQLAVAAYYARDPRSAWAAMQAVRQLEGEEVSARTLQALAVSAAASGHDKEAREALQRMHDAGAKDRDFIHAQ